jgi:serine/threonine protein kinase
MSRTSSTTSKHDQKLRDALEAGGHFKHDYKILKTLGQGAFCKVKLAIHTPTAETVAIKIYNKKMLIEKEGEEGFQELLIECEVLKELHNDHIIRLYETIDTEDFYYMVCEACSGGEVFDYVIAHGHLEEPEACRIFHQCLHAVEYIHKHHIVHHDLKVDNLLMTRHRDVKMIDFGFAERWTPGKPLDMRAGTALYLAPEVFSEDEKLQNKMGPPLDIWALGVILFILVTGEPPFTGEEKFTDDGDMDHDYFDAVMYERIENAKYDEPDYLTEDLKKLFRMIFKPDPDKRPTIKQIRATAWYQTCNDPANELGSEERIDGEIDEEMLDQVVEQGYEAEVVKECLQKQECNNATTSYYLLAKKKAREQRGGVLAESEWGWCDGADSDSIGRLSDVSLQPKIGEQASRPGYSHQVSARMVQHPSGKVHVAHIGAELGEAVRDIEKSLKAMGVGFKEKPQYSTGTRHPAIKCTDLRHEAHPIIFIITIEPVPQKARKTLQMISEGYVQSTRSFMLLSSTVIILIPLTSPSVVYY